MQSRCRGGGLGWALRVCISHQLPGDGKSKVTVPPHQKLCPTHPSLTPSWLHPEVYDLGLDHHAPVNAPSTRPLPLRALCGVRLHPHQELEPGHVDGAKTTHCGFSVRCEPPPSLAVLLSLLSQMTTSYVLFLAPPTPANGLAL